MTELESGIKLTIEPFDPSKHDRTAFSCGVKQVDNFFRKTANKLSKANNVRVHVLTNAGTEVLGFYALNSHAVDYMNLPNKFAKTRPVHGSIPAAYISMIGVHENHQNGGYGELLLIDCLTKIALASRHIGIAVVMLDVLDCGSSTLVQRRKNLYEGYGFQALPSSPLRLFLPVASISQLLD